MRLWHKDLLPVLPRQQLLGQWRECCLIAKTIQEKGTPNHILINKIMDYPLDHFWSYGIEVSNELRNRGYLVNKDRFTRYFQKYTDILRRVTHKDLFNLWHNDTYLLVCYYNLLEKADNGGMYDYEFELIFDLCSNKHII